VGGGVTSADATAASGAVGKSIGQTGYLADADLDRDGTVSLPEANAIGAKVGTAGIPAGRISAYGNTVGWCGYRFNAGPNICTVRFRHFDPTPGVQRWLERDPAGYMDGNSLYSYCSLSPSIGGDHLGLVGNEWIEVGRYVLHVDYEYFNDPASAGNNVHIQIGTEKHGAGTKKFYVDLTDLEHPVFRNADTGEYLGASITERIVKNKSVMNEIRRQARLLKGRGSTGFRIAPTDARGGALKLFSAVAIASTFLLDMEAGALDVIDSQEGRDQYRMLLAAIQLRNRMGVNTAIQNIYDLILAKAGFTLAENWRTLALELVKPLEPDANTQTAPRPECPN
jgi:RHS repeat-associated protein